jgi:hypothetical protein
VVPVAKGHQRTAARPRHHPVNFAHCYEFNSCQEFRVCTRNTAIFWKVNSSRAQTREFIVFVLIVIVVEQQLFVVVEL